MKRGLSVIFIFTSTPALAHHEVIVATSMVPLASSIAAFSVAAFLAWRRGQKK
jgi:hypothetical protein